jgi:hypothetical protein
MLKVFAQLVQIFRRPVNDKKILHHGGAEDAEGRCEKKQLSVLCASAVIFFGCGFAVLRLCGGN